jgi:hypothetical protein
MRKLTGTVLEKLDRIKHLRARELPNGDWEIYVESTGEVIETVPKEEADKATRRLNFQKAQRERRKKADW